MTQRNFYLWVVAYMEDYNRGNFVLTPSSLGISPQLDQILLLCDDVPERTQISEILFRSFGITTCEVNSAEKAKEIFSSRSWLLAILHSSSNPHSALSLCQWIKSRSTIPILMLTNRVELVDEQMALASGADDYILKPVDGRILISRVRQQIERFISIQSSPIEELLTYGSVTLNLTSHEVFVAGLPLNLTRTEFALLKEFLRHQQSLVSREQLMRLLNLTEGLNSGHVIDTHLCRLRSKLSEAGLPAAIITIHGVGFRLAKV